MSKQKMDYDDYVKEREQLSKYEQANYDNYEKTILTLSAAFLAFSVSFLGLVRKRMESGAELLALTSPKILVWSWAFFASSVLFMLICFLVSALGFRHETTRLEMALEDVNALEGKNNWHALVYVLYAMSGMAFITGIVLLLTFCAYNIHIF
jgi:hypothetical protein